MPGLKKITEMTNEEMRATPGSSDWTRLRRELEVDPQALAETRAIGALVERVARKRGRPVEGEPK